MSSRLTRLGQRATLLLLVLAISMPGLTGLVSAQEATRSVTLVLTSDPPSFDPQGSLGPSGPVLLGYLYDTLIYQTETGDLLPALAESWTVEDDGQAITFNLRDDVTFANGAPFNADSVIFTFERLQAVGQRSLIFGEVSNVTAFERVDDYTVRFHLETPSVTILSALTYAYAAILEPGAVTAAGDAYGTTADPSGAPVGTGPFMLAEWITGNTMTLVPNPTYNGHRIIDETADDMAIDELHVRFTNDEATRINALLSGEVDIAYISSAALLEPVQDNPDFRILDSLSRSVIYAGFNTARAPFDNVAVRQAIAHAINKQDILTIATDGMGMATNLPLPPTIFGYNEALEAEGLAYDPETAQTLLAEAGYGLDNPIELELLTLTVPAYQAIATIIQAELAPLGINVNVVPLDYGGMIATMSAGDYDMCILRYGWNDPDVLRLYLSAETIGANNRYFYANPDFDALLATGRQSFAQEDRFAAYTAAQRILLQDVPWIPLYVPVTNVVINNRIQNVDVVHSYVTMENMTLAE